MIRRERRETQQSFPNTEPKPVFPNMQRIKWPFSSVAEVPLALTGERGYMVYPNSLEVLADTDSAFALQFD